MEAVVLHAHAKEISNSFFFLTEKKRNISPSNFARVMCDVSCNKWVVYMHITRVHSAQIKNDLKTFAQIAYLFFFLW